jgi:hypothetical protein
MPLLTQAATAVTVVAVAVQVQHWARAAMAATEQFYFTTKEF